MRPFSLKWLRMKWDSSLSCVFGKHISCSGICASRAGAQSSYCGCSCHRPVSAERLDDPEALKDLLSYLWLYVNRHAWTQLTTEQKELFADVVDEDHRRADEHDGYVGTDMAFTPVERWWRD